MSVYVTGGTLGRCLGPAGRRADPVGDGAARHDLHADSGRGDLRLHARQGREIAPGCRGGKGSTSAASDPAGDDGRDHRHDDAPGLDDSGVQTFLPTWYDEMGYDRLMQSALVKNLPEFA